VKKSKKNKIDKELLNKIIDSVADEVERATSLHGPMYSTHEAYGIIAEEFHEFFLDMISNDLEAGKIEAAQVAAMCIRFIYDSHSWKKKS